MNHGPILPVLLPLLVGALLVLMRGAPLGLRRALSLTAAIAQTLVGVHLLQQADTGAVTVYLAGNWPAWAGIALVVDRLSALMVVLTSTLGAIALLYACAGHDRRTPHFHALFQFQLMGLNGAFLTADLFNLFVFFEVLLIASYGLLLHGAGALRLRRALHYVTINLVASALFLFAVALLYGVVGTLNLADLAHKIALLPAQDAALVRSAGLLLLGVFAVKAALLPVHLWLPATYAAAPAPVAALFAVMTKVGAYAVLRVHGLLFGPEAGVAADLVGAWLLPAGLATLMLAALGALAATGLRRMIGWLVVASAGTLFVALGHAGAPAVAAALYYLVHATIAAAALFLLADLVRRGRGAAGDSLREPATLMHRAPLGLAFVFVAAAAAALPPLSGFLAKLALLQAVALHPAGAWIWGVVLVCGLLLLIALARAGSHLFWRDSPAPTAQTGSFSPRPAERASLGLLMLGLLAWTTFAQPALRYLDATAQQLEARRLWIEQVLGATPVRRAEPAR